MAAGMFERNAVKVRYSRRQAVENSLGRLPEEITKAQYEELSAGLTKSDTPAAVQALSDRKAAQKESYEARRQLQASVPKCLKCGNSLAPRHGPRGRFWGCKSYPACTGTAPFTAEHHRLYGIASRLSH